MYFFSSIFEIFIVFSFFSKIKTATIFSEIAEPRGKRHYTNCNTCFRAMICWYNAKYLYFSLKKFLDNTTYFLLFFPLKSVNGKEMYKFFRKKVYIFFTVSDIFVYIFSSHVWSLADVFQDLTAMGGTPL